MSRNSEQSVEDGTQEQSETQQTVEVNGVQVDLEELKKGYLRQSDYTKKMQELAEQRKASESTQTEGSDDIDHSLETLAEALLPRFAKKFVSVEERELEEFLQKNPELETKRKLLKDLGSTTNKSYWDLAEEYGLKDSDALEKAKTSQKKLVGKSGYEPEKKKSLMDLTPQEYEQWKAQNLGKGEQWVTKKLI